MKKVLFLQMFGKSFGGVWQVIKLVGENLVLNDYDVSVISLRENKNNLVIEADERIKMYTINPEDGWEIQLYSDMIKQATKGHILKAVNMLYQRIIFNYKLSKDGDKLRKLIDEINPDKIVVAHYQLLDLLSKKQLKKTIYQQHSSFKFAYESKGNWRTLLKYNGKVKYLWLSNASKQQAIEKGLKNNYFIYNSPRFYLDTRADVCRNKKIICLSRLSSEKRIDLMVDIVKKAFQKAIDKQWTMEIYGDGSEKNKVVEAIGDSSQIKLMGLTTEVKQKLMTSSINLNTSTIEGFSMTILEANEAGIPTISFDFGESVYEQIENDINGYIASDKEQYIDLLVELIDNPDKLDRLSATTKEFAKKFAIEKTIVQWQNLLD